MVKLPILVVVIIVTSLISPSLATSKVTWVLESYNDWNLPFAKTMEI